MAYMGRLVMVIDDDQDIRELMRLFLESQGYRVKTAADGASAWQHLTPNEVPSLLLVDLFMPGMDGETFIKLMRSGPLAAVPIVVMSGMKMEHEAGRAIQVDEVLIKPVELDQLLHVVHRFASQQAA